MSNLTTTADTLYKQLYSLCKFMGYKGIVSFAGLSLSQDDRHKILTLMTEFHYQVYIRDCNDKTTIVKTVDALKDISMNYSSGFQDTDYYKQILSLVERLKSEV